MVLVTEPSLPALEDIVSDLKHAGMTIDRVQAVLGTVTGSIDADAIPALREVHGVLDVEPDREVGAS